MNSLPVDFQGRCIYCGKRLTTTFALCECRTAQSASSSGQTLAPEGGEPPERTRCKKCGQIFMEADGKQYLDGDVDVWCPKCGASDDFFEDAPAESEAPERKKWESYKSAVDAAAVLETQLDCSIAECTALRHSLAEQTALAEWRGEMLEDVLQNAELPTKTLFRINYVLAATPAAALARQQEREAKATTIQVPELTEQQKQQPSPVPTIPWKDYGSPRQG